MNNQILQQDSNHFEENQSKSKYKTVQYITNAFLCSEK